MKQSTLIFGTLIFAFFVYITMRGQLPRYRALFGSGGNVPNVTSGHRQSMATVAPHTATDSQGTYDMQALSIWNRGGN